MALYTVSERSFINGGLVEPGQVFTADGVPAPHWEPAVLDGTEDAAARSAKDAAAGGEMPTPSDPRYIGDLIDSNVTKAGAGLDQPANLGVVTDASGAVRGVSEGVGTGDPGDGSRSMLLKGDVGQAPEPEAPGVPQDQHDALRAEHDRLQGAYQAITAELSSLAAADEAKSAGLTDARQKQADAETRATAAEAEAAELRAKVAALETDLASATAPDQPSESGEDTGDGDQPSTGRRRRGG